MLTDKLRVFNQLVNSAIGKVGKNPGLIAEDVINKAFPETAKSAEREGADAMLRVGVVARIKGILTRSEQDNQADFSEIAECFLPILDKLHSHSHYVPLDGVHEYVHVSVLIKKPEQLDAARKFKRLKAEETEAEAKVLDELYDAVIAATSQDGAAA